MRSVEETEGVGEWKKQGDGEGRRVEVLLSVERDGGAEDTHRGLSRQVSVFLGFKFH